MSESNGDSPGGCGSGDGNNSQHTTNSLEKSSDSIDDVKDNKKKSSRRCMFGCTDGSSTLCRFPIHDAQRCQDWVDFFQVSDEHIRNNSLVNLRVCMKHFKEKVTMINGKVTRHPSQDSINSNQSSKGTKRSRHSSTSGWNVDASSRASSVHSDCTSDSETKSKRSSNDSLKKLPLEMINGGNRKLFVITPSDSNAVPGQKSKMFLILENGDDNDDTKRHQKITLIADKSDAQTAEKIEQLLPQLIEKIQSANDAKYAAKDAVLLIDSEEEEVGDEEEEHEEENEAFQSEEAKQQDTPDELPIKIQRVETLAKLQPPSKPSPAQTSAKASTKPKTNAVNLSPDFLFLMKMVPKLEAIADPLKTHIKNRIESMLNEPLHEITFEDSYEPIMSATTTTANGLSRT
ncbi:uncharacterized protein LOC129947768 [Eupeodes corollae]|uniref:uncharacterized protein LOC129947768 n=1 Tax=Eupeodes corollae TaxID=290404 RepID=UPI0024928A16|nr:uncharacterized protein LOC129947768 [Eupeodes corollae]